MKLTVCCITAALTMTCFSVAEAQTRSRADLEFGGGFVAGRPDFVLGATVWTKDNNGLAVRGIFQSAFESQGPGYYGLEAMYYRRGFVRDVEIDFGIGMRFLRETSSLVPGEAMDLLVGRRFASFWREGRFGVPLMAIRRRRGYHVGRQVHGRGTVWRTIDRQSSVAEVFLMDRARRDERDRSDERELIDAALTHSPAEGRTHRGASAE